MNRRSSYSFYLKLYLKFGLKFYLTYFLQPREEEKKMTKRQKKENRELILSGNLITAILTLCIPIVINSFIQTMYNLTDTYWLGKIGTDPMAAITLVTPVQNIVVNFGSGITTAGAILISQYIGAGNKADAKRMAEQIFLCSMLFSLLCAGICYLATPSIVSWLGAEGAVQKLSETYLRIVILDMPFLYLINIFTAVHQSQGDTMRPMLLNLFGIILNMVFDPLFMLGLDMGIAGAAFATLLAKVPCAGIAFFALSNRKKEIFIDLKDLHFEKEKLLSIVQIGFPTALGGSTMQLGFLLMTRNVYRYGTLAVAAYGIGNRINSLITMPSNAMGSATGTIVGQNMGAGQIDRVQRTCILARRMTVIFLFIGGLILSRDFVADKIVRIFSKDEAVVPLAVEYLSILAICCWTNGFYNVHTGLFQGTGHTMITMAVDVSRLWVFRFLVLFICETVFQMGVQSIWYAVVISNASSALLLWVLYRTGLWKKNKVKIKKERAEG